MFHLIGTDDRLRAARYYAGMPVPIGEFVGATRALADHVLADGYQFNLLERLENDTGLDTRLSLLIATRACLSRLSASDSGNAGWQRDLAVSRYMLAMYARQREDQAGLVEHLRECFAVLDRMKQRGLHFDPQMAQVYQQLAPMFDGP